MTIGVLALQGDFEAHIRVLNELGQDSVRVASPAALAACDGLIIPGGESTVIGQLCERYDLWEPLRRRLTEGMPALGTCAGMILLARGMAGASANFEQKTLGVLDIELRRNAYGAQVNSFEADITAPALGAEPLRGVFIRAPLVTKTGPRVRVLARHGDEPVLVRQENLVAASFHPELTGETRVHQFWLSLLGGPQGGRA